MRLTFSISATRLDLRIDAVLPPHLHSEGTIAVPSVDVLDSMLRI